MKINEVWALIWQFVVLLYGAGKIRAELKNDTLYPTMLQEYNGMLRQVKPFFLFGKTSCRNSCHEETRNEPLTINDCHCDKYCVAFRDCCLDYWKSCNSSFLDAFNHTQQFECLEPTLELSNRTNMNSHAGNLGYQVITKCHMTFQDPELRKKCENEMEEKSSAFVQDKDGNTYRNEKCALCNGITDWKIWNTSLACVSSTMRLIQARLYVENLTFSYEERKLIRNTCKIKMKPPNGAEGFKCRRRVLECEDKTSPDNLKCLVYKQQLYSHAGLLTVRNPHCTRCRESPLLFQLSLINRIQEEQGDNSLAILFDFSKASQIYGEEEIEHTQSCPTGEIYDFQQKSCRKQRFMTSDKTVEQNWTCEFMNETFPNSSAFIVVLKNGSVFVPAHQKLYKSGDYYWQNGTITVCGNLTKLFSMFKNTNSRTALYTRAESYLTVIGYTLSIFALLVVLVTYSLFSELRTLPGKLVMNLAVALLLSQIVFLVDMFEDISGSFCTGIAVVLHLLYLASFCWMNAIAFDVAKTFATQGRRSQTHSQKRAFFLCFLYAWGLPLLLVIIAFGVDNSGAMDVGYGNARYCWITNPWALAIFFVAPVIILLVFNIIALVLVLVIIRRERKITKKVIDKPTTKQDFGICWKLTAIFGLTWFLGLGAPYHIALRIAFILCNSLQGFLLMVGFIMTRRTLNLYLRMTGMQRLISRTGPTRSTMNSSRIIRRRRSSFSVGKVWAEKPKPTTTQHSVPDGLEEIPAIKKSFEEPDHIKLKTIETDV